jgi:acyl carrier protein
MGFKQRLRDYIGNSLAGDSQAGPITDDTPLLDHGVIDSMGLMQLVMFIEEQTGVRVPDEEVLPDNFQSVTSIEQLVERLQARRAPTSDDGGV